MAGDQKIKDPVKTPVKEPEKALNQEPAKKKASQWQNSWRSKQPFQWSAGVIRGPGKWIGRTLYDTSAAAEKSAEETLQRMKKIGAQQDPPTDLITALGLEYLGPVPTDE